MMAVPRRDKIREFGGQPRRRKRKPMKVGPHLLCVALGGAEAGQSRKPARVAVTGHRKRMGLH